MRFLLFILCSVFLVDCNVHPKDPYKNNLGVSEKYVAAIDTAHFTTVEWLDTTINLGSIKEGNVAFANFKFKNTGKIPLFILSVYPSCGCTIINYPHNIIYPDSAALINAKFNTAHTHGFTRKTILVSTNTGKHNKTLLAIEANVVAYTR